MLIVYLTRVLVTIVLVFSGSVLAAITIAPLLPSTGAISYAAVEVHDRSIYLRIRDIDRHIDRQLVSQPLANGVASWSPDGERVVYTAFTRSGLHIEMLHIRSGKTVRLTDQTSLIGWRGWRSHEWSPDGECIAFTRDGDVFLHCFANSHTRQMTDRGINHFVTWAPDGQHLLFTSTRDGTTDLYTLALANGTERQITMSGVAKTAPDYTPDGGSVVFGTFFRDMGQIMRYDIDTGDVQQITESGRGFSPTISSDGRYMVYGVPSAQTRWDIYVMELATGHIRVVTAFPGEELVPIWVPLP
ncbi:MAG: hypothetical protein AAF787_16825 [Chloroflexota bacterium]